MWWPDSTVLLLFSGKNNQLMKFTCGHDDRIQYGQKIYITRKKIKSICHMTMKWSKVWLAASSWRRSLIRKMSKHISPFYIRNYGFVFWSFSVMLGQTVSHDISNDMKQQHMLLLCKYSACFVGEDRNLFCTALTYHYAWCSRFNLQNRIWV